MKITCCSVALLVLLVASVSSQTTAFKYQGSLTDGGSPANGAFQMQFKLFDAVSSGAQIGSTLNDVPVTATQGVFSVSLDFGSNALNGANRWIEISVRRNAGESYVTLGPRERIASSPYAVRTLSAATADTALDSQKLGGVNANQFVQTNDARLTDARSPLPNSASYIQNQNAGPQSTSNFNISGNGVVGGNLGVGTSSTSSKLTVNGTIESTSGGIKFPDATVQSSAAAAAEVRQPFFASNGSTVVPAGKLLIVEYVSGVTDSTTTAPLPWVTLSVNNNARAHIPPRTWSDQGGTRLWYYDSQVRLYVSAGETLQITNATFTTGLKYVHGYYVNVP